MNPHETPRRAGLIETRDDHRRAADGIRSILDTQPHPGLTAEARELLSDLARHHERLGAVYGTCRNCGLSVTLPDPDRGGPECGACGGATVDI